MFNVLLCCSRGARWVADGQDADTLAGLACVNGQVAKRNAGAWVCRDDTGVTTPGTGISIAGSQVSIAAPYRLPHLTQSDSPKADRTECIAGCNPGSFRLPLRVAATLSGGVCGLLVASVGWRAANG